MLEGQCGAWGSIIAAAVHVPMVNGKIVSGAGCPAGLLNGHPTGLRLPVRPLLACWLLEQRGEGHATACASQSCLPDPCAACSCFDAVTPPATLTTCPPPCLLIPAAELPELAGHDASAPLELISQFHERMERRGRCKLDVVLLTEEVESAEMVGLYPVNALRNKALSISQTEVGGAGVGGGRGGCGHAWEVGMRAQAYA
jgi:hypothetical protein